MQRFASRMHIYVVITVSRKHLSYKLAHGSVSLWLLFSSNLFVSVLNLNFPY